MRLRVLALYAVCVSAVVGVIVSSNRLLMSQSSLDGITLDNMPTGSSGSHASARSTSLVVDPIFQSQYDIIDNADMKERCTKYGLEFNNGQKSRRIFFGAMVADESYDIIRIHAAEAYGLYHVVALVESNATHMNTPRTLRFDPGTDGHNLLQSGIFGPNVSVYLDIFTGDAFGAMDLDREEIQREEILLRWKKAGMREDDVGVMADFDEVFTRDFLHAVKHCDIPALRPGQNCQMPRVHVWSMVFEGSPECISSKRWFHPDFMIGECIKYVGDPRGHPIPVRFFKEKYGERADGWGRNATEDYSDEVMKNGSFPLANAADMRTGIENYAQDIPIDTPAGFHFHNFFETGSQWRHKYTTYAHPNLNVPNMKMSEIHEDIDITVRCVHNISNSANPTGVERVEGGFDAISELRPIYFLNKTYRLQRHAHLKEMVDEDEHTFGENYQDNRTTS